MVTFISIILKNICFVIAEQIFFVIFVVRYAEDDHHTRPDSQRQDVAGGGIGLQAAPRGAGGRDPERRLAAGVSWYDHRHGQGPRRLCC